MEATKTSRTATAVNRLRELILEGELQAGDRLIEERLTARFGLSRVPLRIALGRLKHQGLLESIPGRGFAVRSFSLQAVGDAICLRGQLEGAAARLAAERNRGAEPLGQLIDTVTGLDRVVGNVAREPESNVERYGELNDVFHAELFVMADNDVLRDAYEALVALPFARPSAFLVYQAERPILSVPLEFAHRQHHRILDAIETGDGDAAEALARGHADLARHELRAVIRRDVAIARLPGSGLISFDGEPSCCAEPGVIARS